MQTYYFNVHCMYTVVYLVGGLYPASCRPDQLSVVTRLTQCLYYVYMYCPAQRYDSSLANALEAQVVWYAWGWDSICYLHVDYKYVHACGAHQDSGELQT